VTNALQMALVLVALCTSLFLTGCAARQPETIDAPVGIERPARPLSEEEGLADRIGEIGVVLLVIVVSIGGILLPILLL